MNDTLAPYPSNAPPDGLTMDEADRVVAARGRLQAFLNTWAEWANAEITDENAGRFRDYQAGLQAVLKQIEADRVELKEPHLSAGRAVDAAFAPIKASADTALKRVKGRMEAFLKVRKAEAEAKARAEREAAEAQQRAAEAAAAKARESQDIAAEVEAEAAQAAAAKAAQAAAKPVQARVESESGGARAVGLKQRRVIRLEDVIKACVFFQDQLGPELERLAREHYRQTKELPPGFRIDIEEGL